MGMNTNISGTKPADETPLSNDMHPTLLFRMAGLSAVLQFLCTVTTMIVVITLGMEPSTAEEYFALLNADRITGILRLDLTSLINVVLFTGIVFGAYAALRPIAHLYTFIAMLLVCMGVVMAVSSHSAFSMIYLSDQYAAAQTDPERIQLLAAARAVIASDWWRSTAGFFAGLFLQGGMVIISVFMLRSRQFARMTALSGILSNGLDFTHILVGLILPGVAGVLLMIGGIFYLLWFPLLSRDFWKLGRPGVG